MTDLSTTFGDNIRATAISYVEGDRWIAARGASRLGIYKRVDVLKTPTHQVGCSFEDGPLSQDIIARAAAAMRDKYGPDVGDKVAQALNSLEKVLA